MENVTRVREIELTAIEQLLPSICLCYFELEPKGTMQLYV